MKKLKFYKNNFVKKETIRVKIKNNSHKINLKKAKLKIMKL